MAGQHGGLMQDAITAKASARSRHIWGTCLKYLALICICVLSASIRLFSVAKYESVIHEFDPWFNYRVTEHLSVNGFYDMWNWFDQHTWYPLGRAIGGTLYPGLIFTAGGIYKLLQALHITVHVQDVCVFMGPLFSAFCALASFGLVREARGDGAGLLAAAFVGMVPSYISRSVAGSYDNESVAIFALVNVFFLFIKTVNTGSMAWATLEVLAYFYMVMSWGGYSFVINLLPIFCLACIASGRLTSRLYVAFAPLVIIGTLGAASVPVVGFNAVLMSEHFGAFFAFVVLHVALLFRWVRATLPPKQLRMVMAAVLSLVLAAGGIALAMVVAYVLKSPTYGWTGRSLSLLDPTYASKYIPIIASVSEHQPPNWSSYLMDLHCLVLFVPAGLIACYTRRSDAALFLILYGITAVYFSSVMVRLMLVLAPATCCLAAVAISDLLNTCCASLKHQLSSLRRKAHKQVGPGDAASDDEDETVAGSPTSSAANTPSKPSSKAAARSPKKAGPVSARAGIGNGDADIAKTYPLSGLASFGMLALVGALLALFVMHCIYASSDMYSSPSVVLQSPKQGGGYYVFDDFREAYSWLRHNTHPDTKVASWWDYGYQTTAMANRTVIVDNNTWNNTHIATVGRAMASPEAKAWQIFRSLDVEYVFVVFGGYIGYPSDDINKFLWMVRIGGGVYPEIKEPDYLAGGNDYRIDASAPKTMTNCLMYRLSYYDFAEASEMVTGQRGLDRVRNTIIGKQVIKLQYFEEVFTSQHWMMRIYRVRDQPVRDATKAAKARRKGRG